MPLNIKDDKAHADAKRLAALTGETITRAVAEAIAERLAAVEAKHPEGAAVTAERLLALGRICSAEMAPGKTLRRAG
ncbi:MAG: type II toxin-antitoxin system VapB family antitoxin [Pseudomonadota bacterium]